MTDPIETGEIHFFYRVKIDTEDVSGSGDVQRLFMALVPDETTRARLFIVGRKRLPDIIPGESDPTERNWLMVSSVDSPETVGRELHPVRYETKTRGEREVPQAVPAGSGRYAIVSHDDATQLAYRLSSPGTPGEAQDALCIRPEARYILSVRNPSLDVPGFPDAEPDYPDTLADRFADERWIDISDPRLLDYKKAQLVMIGASEDLSALNVDLDGKSDPFSTFSLDADVWPDETLHKGEFVAPEDGPDDKPEPVAPAGDRSKGGRRGGATAAGTDSAAGVASALKGVSFPSGRSDLVQQARHNDAPDEVLELLQDIPDQDFETMADVTKAVGKVR